MCAKTWLLQYQGVRRLDTAGQLESEFGARIRQERPHDVESVYQLVQWIYKQYSINVSVRVAQNWQVGTWGRDSGLYTPEEVEDALGDRLRLAQHAHLFQSDVSAQSLSETLEESQPSVKVSALLLRQWYAKYHPAAGRLHYVYQSVFFFRFVSLGINKKSKSDIEFFVVVSMCQKEVKLH